MPTDDAAVRKKAVDIQLVPQALKRMRQRAGYLQAEVAEKSGLTPAMVSAYEAGKASPSLGSLSVYLGAIQRDLGDLQDEVNRLSGRFIDAPPEDRERAVGRAILKALEHLGDEVWFALRLKGKETTTKED